MKLTMTNKDHIARLIAEEAYKLPATTNEDNIRYNQMLRISEALENIGEVGSRFRKLTDLRHVKMPPVVVDEKENVIDANETYFDALCKIVQSMATREAA